MHYTSWTLTIWSFACAAVAIVTLALAVSTDHWIIVWERFCHTPEFPVNFTDTERCTYINLTSKLGLWRYCTTVLGLEEPPRCLHLEYRISLKTERIENQLPSASIAEAQLGATPFFIVSLLLVVGSGILCVVGNLQGNGKTLVAAIFSIIAGLAMGVGIIFYITFINDEVSHAKSNTRNKFESYKYGWSFFLVGLSFLASESAAVVCVKLYLKRNAKREDMIRIIPGLEDKFTSDEPGRGLINYSTLIL